ncbi:MAG: prolyl oligopeptidase family serine peptidase [Chryseolinea sp.]
MPLTRKFYSLAIFAAALHAIVYFIQGIAYFLAGQQLYVVPIFFTWYLVHNTIVILASVIYINYFRQRKDTFSHWSLLMNIVSGIFATVIFTGAMMRIKEWIPFYMTAQLILLVSTCILGLAFVFSRAGKGYWLRAAGLLLFITALILLAATIQYHESTMPNRAATIELIVRWFSLTAWIGPVFIMMNLRNELKELPSEKEALNPARWEPFVSGLQVIAMLATLVLSLTLVTEATEKFLWLRKLARQTDHWEEVRGARTFVGSKGQTLRYQLIYPESMDSAAWYPMVVCLPYGGGIDGSPAAKFLLKKENRDKYPAFLFVPFCPEGSGWGGVPGYPTVDTVVFEGIEAVEQEIHSIDANRVYITGVSRGAYGSWHFISQRPDLFAAAMPVCGAGDPNGAANMIDVSIWAFHGEDDVNVPVSGSRDMIAAIQKAGGEPKYTEFPNAGHNIWEYVIQTPGVFDWLFQQRRAE